MNEFEKNIGKNIKEVRVEKSLSQENLANMCNITNTALSAYENSRKIPNLSTIAKIAKALNVSIERLYYGDDNSSFITSEPDFGKKIVNSINCLWEQGVIKLCNNITMENILENWSRFSSQSPPLLLLSSTYSLPLLRLIHSLDEYRDNAATYCNPEQYLECIRNSVATQINKIDK